MKDLTPQECVKEARKIMPEAQVVSVNLTVREGFKDKWWLVCVDNRLGQYLNISHEAPTLRSCLAKLKKEIGR